MTHFLDSIAYNYSKLGKAWWEGMNDIDYDRVVRVAEDMEPHDARHKAGLYWEPIRTPQQYQGLDGNWYPISHEDYQCYIRSDNGALLAIVGRKHRFLANFDLFAIIERCGLKVQSAGALHGGRKVFAQSPMPGDLSVTRRNGSKLEIAPFALWYNSHDGSSHLEVLPTSIAAVCANTVNAGRSEGASSAYKIRHTAAITNVEAVGDEINRIFEFTTQSFDEQRAVLQQLAVTPMGRVAAHRFFEALLTNNTTPEATLETLIQMREKGGRSWTILNTKRDKLLDLFSYGLGNQGESMLDALQAVTQAIDHQEFRSDDWKKKPTNISAGLDSAMFGSGNDLKRQAVQLLEAGRW